MLKSSYRLIFLKDPLKLIVCIHLQGLVRLIIWSKGLHVVARCSSLLKTCSIFCNTFLQLSTTGSPVQVVLPLAEVVLESNSLSSAEDGGSRTCRIPSNTVLPHATLQNTLVIPDHGLQ